MEKIASIFIFKLLDCVFSVLKNAYFNKGEYFISAVSAAVGMVCFAYAIQQMEYSALLAIGTATFVGTYIPPKVIDYLEEDELYIYEITSTDLDSGKRFADKLRESNIPVSTSKVRDKHMNKVLVCRVYSTSKAISRQIEDIKPKEFSSNITSGRRR